MRSVEETIDEVNESVTGDAYGNGGHRPFAQVSECEIDV